jgi:hypothetical protein
LRERFDTNGAAGLWVHFLFHGIEFLRPGGRLAYILPASALFSDYGRSALERISNSFANIEIRQIVDRPIWTNGADERGILLLAEGYSRGSSALPEPTRWSSHGLRAKALPLSNTAYDNLAARSFTLGSIASLAIGAVTGCNSVFLLDEAERKALQIAKSDLRPVVSRARQIGGITVDRVRLVGLARNGEKTWLLTPKGLGGKGSGVRRRLAEISARRRTSTLWFSKRDPWWRVDVGDASDAFFTYMNDRGPRLVLVQPDIRCTNTLHCVRFEEQISRAQRLAASLTLISSFGQLAAERIGRSYGGGLLKFELKDARSFPILPEQPGLEEAFEAADRALVAGQATEAARIADEALVAPLLGSNWERLVHDLRAEISARRELRRGSR